MCITDQLLKKHFIIAVWIWFDRKGEFIMILMISHVDVLKEYILPRVNGVDHEIVLKKGDYKLRKDVHIQLENTDNQWYIKRGADYFIENADHNNTKTAINNDDVLSLGLYQGLSVKMIAVEAHSDFQVYKKYDVMSKSEISIGADKDNDIVYSFLSFVSRHHACLYQNRGVWMIIDKSRNGVFVNEKRVRGQTRLSFGDEVNIFGIRIICLGNIIAVGSHYGTIMVKDLKELTVETDKSGLEVERMSPSDVFRRSPRSVPVIYNDDISIELPPEPNFMKNRPLWLRIGSSLTMAIPMLLGFLIIFLSSRKKGNYAGAFMYMGIIMAVGSAFFGALWAYLNVKNDRQNEIDEEDKRYTTYSNYLIDISKDVKEKYIMNRRSLISMYPSARHCCRYNRHTPQLWNRNPGHSDFLFYRLGMGDIPFQVTINTPKNNFDINKDPLKEKAFILKNNYQKLINVPIGIDLRCNSFFGIVGGLKDHTAENVMFNVVAGIAANNCYTDVKMVFVYEKEQRNIDWEFTKWFPHVWSDDKKVRYVASNETERTEVFYELSKILRSRQKKLENSSDSKVGDTPVYVMFISDVSLMENQMIAKYVYDKEHDLGFKTFIIAENYGNLPNECDFVIEKTSVFQGYTNVRNGEKSRTHIAFDPISSIDISQLAISISSVRVNEISSNKGIPNSVDFLSIYGVSDIKELNVLERWYKNRTFNTMRALLGKKSGDADCYLDIHEKVHGPHGLIAGTTGSGKSELLQTYILSMAVNYSPYDVAFFVIDFKGGGMANLFSDLPHMSGQISNLSGNQITRAMISIKSENIRRQKIFAEYGVNNINDYTKLYKNNEAKTALPHLIIIIDEFAELKQEKPDFLVELISVARVGRSLGVHLILATQKPSGSVDDNIRSNSNFRICLRVQDRQDSIDMIYRPDAAFINQVGRCYLQVGNGEVNELLQSGWSGAAYNEWLDLKTSDVAEMIGLNGKTSLVGNRSVIKNREKQNIRYYDEIIRNIIEVQGRIVNNDAEIIAEDVIRRMSADSEYGVGDLTKESLIRFIKLYMNGQLTNGKDALEIKKSGVKIPELKEKRQIDVLVKYIAKTARDNGFDDQFTLWLAPLSDHISFEDLDCEELFVFKNDRWSKHDKKYYDLKTYVGIYDDPTNRTQEPVVIDFAKNGHIAVFGTVVSGKSTFLQTMIYGLANMYDPNELNTYIFDYSNRKLSCFETLPHVGGIFYDNDNNKIKRFFAFIEKEIESRKNLFNGGNYSDYVRAYEKKIPAIVVVIDNFSHFREKTNNEYDTKISRIARDGVGYGIYLAVSAAGIGTNELPMRLFDSIHSVYCLEMGDKYKYMETLRMPSIPVLPEHGVQGRGILKVNDRILEFQTARSFLSDDEYLLAEELEKMSSDMRKAWTGKTAFKVPTIPDSPKLSDLINSNGFEDAIRSDDLIPIGYDEESAEIECIDLSEIYCYTVSGCSGSGKTNTLKVILHNVANKNGKTYVVDSNRQELRSSVFDNDITYINDNKGVYEMLMQLKGPFVERNKLKHEMLDKGMTDSQIREHMLSTQPYHILIDSLEDFLKLIYEPDETVGKMSGFVENILAKGQSHNIYFFAGINTDIRSEITATKAYEQYLSYKCGVHLGGRLDRQHLIDVSDIPYAEQIKPMQYGMAVDSKRYDNGGLKKIVIPLFGGE